jgi:hypothetical protein
MKKIKRTNYRSGADTERRAKRDLLFPRKNLPAMFRADRWINVVRSAGSKGDYDLIAMGHSQALLLSVKRVGTKADARRVLGRELTRLNKLPLPPYARAAAICWVPQYGWMTSGLIEPRSSESA